MIYTQSPLAIGLFVIFVLFVLGLSFYLARRTSSAEAVTFTGSPTVSLLPATTSQQRPSSVFAA
jgi:hypothetical protein